MSQKRLICSAALLLVILFTGCIEDLDLGKDQAPTSCEMGSIQSYFCPEDNCDDIVIQQIENAQLSIHVAIFSFTRDNIGQALIDAANRGVEVKIVFDEGQASKYSEYWTMEEQGFDVRLDGSPYYMHNKFMIIDGKIVLTGSYNWSDRATEKNDENFVIIYSQEIAAFYEAEFKEIYNQAM